MSKKQSYETVHSKDSWCGVPGCPCGGKEAWEKRQAVK
jgi:hypothetical protein